MRYASYMHMHNYTHMYIHTYMNRKVLYGAPLCMYVCMYVCNTYFIILYISALPHSTLLLPCPLAGIHINF